MLGVVNEVPVPNDIPAVATLYQFIVPADAIALKVTVPASQREFGVVEVIVGIGFTVAMISFLGIVEQFPLVASTK